VGGVLIGNDKVKSGGPVIGAEVKDLGQDIGRILSMQTEIGQEL
jgi:hypothetical protein